VPLLATDRYTLYMLDGERRNLVAEHLGHDRHPERRLALTWLHAVALHWSMRHIYGVQAGTRFSGPSDVGLVVGPFLLRVTAAALWLHLGPVEGKSRRHPRCRRVLAGHRRDMSRVFFNHLRADAFRAIKREDPGRQI